jgi:hypothetical protein
LNFELNTSFNDKHFKMKYCGTGKFSAAKIPFYFPSAQSQCRRAEIQPSGFIFNYHDEYT